MDRLQYERLRQRTRSQLPNCGMYHVCVCLFALEFANCNHAPCQYRPPTTPSKMGTKIEIKIVNWRTKILTTLRVCVCWLKLCIIKCRKIMKTATAAVYANVMNSPSLPPAELWQLHDCVKNYGSYKQYAYRNMKIYYIVTYMYIFMKNDLKLWTYIAIW